MTISAPNIPSFSFQEFIKKIYPDEIIPGEKNKNQPKKTTVAQRINQNSERKKIAIASTENENAKNNLENTIKKLIPTIKSETIYDLVLWTRISISVAIYHDSNARKIFKEYLKWRSQEGRDFFAVQCREEKNHIHIDKFILKGFSPIDHFSYQWIAIKPALEKIQNKPKGKSLAAKYGKQNIAKIKEALDKSDGENIVNLEKNKDKKSPKKEYIYFGKIDFLYEELTKNHNLLVKKSIFRSAISNFAEIRYRGKK